MTFLYILILLYLIGVGITSYTMTRGQCTGRETMLTSVFWPFIFLMIVIWVPLALFVTGFDLPGDK